MTTTATLPRVIRSREEIASITRHYHRIRAPHHTASVTAYRGTLTARDRDDRDDRALDYTPGELALANNGALVLFDLPEFPRAVLELIGDARRSGYVLLYAPTVQVFLRVHFRCELVLTAAPCPCGRYGQSGGASCCCSAETRDRFEKRIGEFRYMLRD